MRRVMAKVFLMLGPFQFIAVVATALTLLVLGDALAGHLRSGFRPRVQYAPFATGGLLLLLSVAAAVRPSARWIPGALELAAWLAIATGLAGFFLHHYYGIARKPGSYKLLLHHLMYGAPPLAPLALSAAGVLGLVAAEGLQGETTMLGLAPRTLVLTVVAAALAGAILQTGLLHYRGAFNSPLMYVPLTVPSLAAVGCAWMAAAPSVRGYSAVALLLWLTFLIGFLGLGMHLRGFDRQMGGLYVPLFNWLEGPPAFAPGLYSGFSAAGLTAIYLM